MLTVANRQLIACGRTAEVYAWDNSTVLKLFFDWLPSEFIEREAYAASIIATYPVPSAKFIGTLSVSNRRGLIFERVDGPSMVALMSSKPWLLSRQALLFANLHFLVHSQPGDGLPQLKTVIREAINKAQSLTPELRAFALQVLDSLPDGHSLCHCDFHPEQIVMTATGPRILDWMSACQGDPMADVARTSVLFVLGHIPSQLSFFTRTFIYIARGPFYRRYLKEYLRLNRKADLETVKRWMIPLSAARLYENIPGDAGTILPFLQRALAQNQMEKKGDLV